MLYLLVYLDTYYVKGLIRGSWSWGILALVREIGSLVIMTRTMGWFRIAIGKNEAEDSFYQAGCYSWGSCDIKSETFDVAIEGYNALGAWL